MLKPWIGIALFSVLLSGCASLSSNSVAGPSITMPLIPGWFNDQRVYYITTDASPVAAATGKNANFAPRLSDALPPRPKPPELKTVIERIYGFPEGDQPTILPSAPDPIGATSVNRPYSPIWQIYEVRWIDEAARRELTSESALFDAEANGWVSITATDMVVNCAVVADGEGRHLPGSVVNGI
ncbi:DUF7482 domain-containing protein [Saccharospirillum mangrovi]|uniref:DUF7482 domain-containing protein n=1 Tax=Saccharospirillum mangrovi TaxID=2161747 RepID=UPI000D3615BC|nr:hypothetical protein [Saccharospirillum mangrovi]